MVGFSVPSFISNDFAFVKCVRVISISSSSPRTAWELHWQETQLTDFCMLPIQSCP